MKIPKYWKQISRSVDGVSFHKRQNKGWGKNTAASIHAWGHSEVSERAAKNNAVARIDLIIAALAEDFDEGFYYPLNVIHEDIIHELETGQNGRAVITRNRYFSRILNTDDLMFVDIDIPVSGIPTLRFWHKLLGLSSRVKHQNAEILSGRYDAALALIETYTAANPEVGFLVYRTFAGFRLIASHKPFKANAAETSDIFEAVGADPLYQKLCKAQDCFRARLTPKFWRLDMKLGKSPELKFRLTKTMIANWTETDEQRVRYYDSWVKQYEASHKSHATCQFVKHIGNTNIYPALVTIIEYHDIETQAHSNKPLA